jgi:hypothetical protein
MFAALALLALTSLTFGQAKMVSWDYPGDWVCDVPGARPMTFGECFDTLAPITLIPDGTVMNILVNGVPTFTFALNGATVCGAGTFTTYYFFINAGAVVVLDLVYQGCHYVSGNFTITTDETFLMYQADWTCSCQNPGCDVKEEQGGLLPGRSMEPAEGESDGLSDSGSGLGSAASSTVR